MQGTGDKRGDFRLVSGKSRGFVYVGSNESREVRSGLVRRGGPGECT
jgi:hypothetical protein